jgi:hypothetical protein
MRRFCSLAVLATAGSWVLHAQTCTPTSAPCITSLQSDFVKITTPTHGAAITAGTPVTDIWLFVNGNFSPGAFSRTVTWAGVGAPAGQVLATVASGSLTQVIVDVPAALFASAGTASITVSETFAAFSGTFTSPPATYTVNAPLAALTLASGSVGTAYSQPLASGGTGYYSISFAGGNLPPGMTTPYQPGPSVQTDTAFAGTPTTFGTFTFGMSIVDSWNNSTAPTYSLTIFPTALPTITSLSQSSAPYAACVTFTITGQNFASGYAAVFVIGKSLATLPTTFVSATQLSVQLPPVATGPGVYAIQVEVVGSFSSPVLSNAVPFTLLAPAISGLVRPFGTVGAAFGTQLTVNGSNFAQLSTSAACLTPGSIVEYGTNPVPTTFNSSSQLVATLPALTAPGTVPVTVFNLAGNSNSVNFTVNPAPSITSVSPAVCTASSVATAGCGTLSLQITGANFFGGAAVVSGVPNNQEAVLWDGVQVAFGTVNSTTSITTSIPITVLTPGTHQVSVITFDGVASNRVAFTVNAAPVLRSVQPNPITSPGTAATLTLTGANFLAGMKVQWQGPSGGATLTPSSLTANQIVVSVPSNLTAGGTATVAVLSTDPAPVSSNSLSVSIVNLQQPLVITTASPLTPAATAGVYYSNVFSATGGDTSSYTYAFASGALPSGMTLFEDGRLVGTAPAPGTFTFVVQVTDASGNTTTKAFTLVVNPPPLTMTTSPFGSIAVGTAVNTTFAAKGGSPPYTFASSGTLPPGTQFSGAALTGTVTTPGSYSFTVTVTDSAQGTASQGYTITVTGAALSITTSSPLAGGQVGVVYGGVQFQAAGGTGADTWSGSALPPGMSLSASGMLSGTPTKAGTFNIGATVTDAAKTTASSTFAITISGMSISTPSLPNGTVGSAYGGSMAANGGVLPLSWSATGLPASVALSNAGSFSGTPTAAGSSTVTVTVTDSAGNTDSKSYTLKVNPAPLNIAPSGTVPPATAGSSFSLGFSVTGGTSPYSFAAAGLPGGLSISTSTGAISGTPAAAGSSNVTVTVTDSAGVTASTSFTITVGLPPAPPLNFTGLSVSVNPGSQSSVGVSLGSPYPAPITVKLTLSFSGTDPAVQFATGGTTATITIPAGQTTGSNTVGVQTGTVAGTITITAQLSSGTQDITPSPSPKTTITVPATAPVISSVTATRTSSGFTVTVVGYSSTRALGTANFTFNGTNLATTTLTLQVDAIFSPWYQSSASAQFGSNFTYTQPFTTANPGAVTSVTVTLTNTVGTSGPATATLQ